MSGDSNNDRQVVERRLARRELIATVCGFVVGAGLLIEYGDELVDCFVNWHPPSRQLFGGLLVTVGVFGEVLFARLALTTSRTLQERADSDVAQANKRAAEAIGRAVKAEENIAELSLAADQASSVCYGASSLRCMG